jgi:hypothetical protein
MRSDPAERPAAAGQRHEAGMDRAGQHAIVNRGWQYVPAEDP